MKTDKNSACNWRILAIHGILGNAHGKRKTEGYGYINCIANDVASAFFLFLYKRDWNLWLAISSASRSTSYGSLTWDDLLHHRYIYKLHTYEVINAQI